MMKFKSLQLIIWHPESMLILNSTCGGYTECLIDILGIVGRVLEEW